MSDFQRKTVKGPVKLVQIHSSGRCMAIHDEKNVFMDNGIPGEEVLFTTQRRKLGFRTGSIARILLPSKFRIYPYCIHSKECGGCPWQHIEYSNQLTLKSEILVNALKKYNIPFTDIPKVIPSPMLHFYRHRMEYSFSAPDILGFHSSEDSKSVNDILECYLQPRMSRAICEFIKAYSYSRSVEYYDAQADSGFLRSLSIRINKDGQIMLVLGLHRDDPGLREKLMTDLMKKFKQIVSLNYTVHLSPRHSQLHGEICTFKGTQPYIMETSGEFKFRIHASSFFQPNVAQAGNIFQTIREWAQAGKNDKVVDLYTGVGTIAHYLAKDAGHVTGIEGSAQAIEDARANAEMNNLKNTHFIQGDILKTFTTGFLRENGSPDLIVLDPPRSGTLIEIKKTINASGARKVIYLSCNPVSLAFDLKQLTEVYHITRIQPFDMLPHTHHLETVVMLERK